MSAYSDRSKVAREVKHNKMAQLPESTDISRSLDTLRRELTPCYTAGYAK